MIEREQVMPLLLHACTSFEERWTAYLSDAYSAGDERLLYCELGEFAHHLIQLASSDDTSEMPAIFEVIERLHLEGTPYVREAATIGLLEGIQNTAVHNGFDLANLTPYLRPESAYWWQQLNDFWEGRIRIVGEGPRRTDREEN